MSERIDDLRRRREEALNAGSERAVKRQHDKGKLLARERIDYLLDDGSFNEIDLFARTQNPGAEERPYTDGVVTGWGTIDGRKVFVSSQDFTIAGGSTGETNAAKIHKLMDLALSVGAPYIGLNDGGGARIPRGWSASTATAASSGATSRPPASSPRSASSWAPVPVVRSTAQP